MESYKITALSFKYPGQNRKAVDNINLVVEKGEFVCVCGKSGCGKTTLLRLMKAVLAPSGEKQGEILFEGKSLEELSTEEQARKIGFVMQETENQIVTDKVWHELAFGLESLGRPKEEIRARVAEIASYFGITDWFYKNTDELSGGQKQILSLASVMAMQPQVLILDEPTSQLDPIAAGLFFQTLEKINRELGTTVIISEHRLEEVFPIADRVVVMDNGNIIANEAPDKIGELLNSTCNDNFRCLPTPVRVYCSVEKNHEAEKCPVSVREGRKWLERYVDKSKINLQAESKNNSEEKNKKDKEPCIEIKDVWFRYEKDAEDVLKGLNLCVKKGEIYSVLGGNGAGKTTLLSVAAGLKKPYLGKVLINGTRLEKIDNLYDDIIGVVPQNPIGLFTKKSLYLDLIETAKGNLEEREKEVKKVVGACGLSHVLNMHPLDLSGGEKQRAALCKVLLSNPEIIMLDEPTKGIDGRFKEVFAGILFELKKQGKTVVMVSHDVEFCAKVSDRCGMFFDGIITSEEAPDEFFSNNSFYTTAASRMARKLLPGAVLAEDIIAALGGKTEKIVLREAAHVEMPAYAEKKSSVKAPLRVAAGALFCLLLFVICLLQVKAPGGADADYLQLLSIIALGAAFLCFVPPKKEGIRVKAPKKKGKLPVGMLLSVVLVLIAIPFTIFMGAYYLQDRKYYFISLLVIAETFIPFLIGFERKKNRARELVVIAVLCAMAVCGRTAFTMLPQFKPSLAIIIVAGICFGAQSGFLVGAITAFVSNFFFGQGPWTPWQMFAMGIVGFISGLILRKDFFPKTRTTLSVFGFLATVVIYGGVLNPASVIMMQQTLTIEAVVAACAAGFPFDVIHGLSTAFFLWFASEAVIEKIERTKVKYGMDT